MYNVEPFPNGLSFGTIILFFCAKYATYTHNVLDNSKISYTPLINENYFQVLETCRLSRQVEW